MARETRSGVAFRPCRSGSSPSSTSSDSTSSAIGSPARDDESELDFDDYQGDVHSHTNWSDGRATMLEMAQGAQALGYSYLGITDHSPRITVVHGLNAERLVAQAREMAEVQKQVDGVTLLQGIEVDILEDGELDLPDSVLELLDVVIASPHVKLRPERRALIERM